MKITIKQTYRVGKFITVEIQESELENYLNGDFETPCSSNEGWEDYWSLENEEVIP